MAATLRNNPKKPLLLLLFILSALFFTSSRGSPAAEREDGATTTGVVVFEARSRMGESQHDLFEGSEHEVPSGPNPISNRSQHTVRTD
ncbi:hypothetical protein M569_06431 [Genlisea aurea]|uniref:Uncharacterized protein n=1 Tax=Genlisea aurea TaxID=192259 RepID=S8CMH8_9LAMI|nr:hypothetical protein M569_06431 [Genlisea aurea]